MSPLNSDLENIQLISFTFDTFHFEMSPLNWEFQNIYLIFVTFDTSHSEMSPLNSDSFSPTPKEPTGGKPKRTGLWMALAALAIVGIVIGMSLKPEEEIVDETVEEVVEEDSYDKPLTFTVNGVSFRMLPVEGGTFTMGATAEQGSDARDNEKPTHSVTLSSYYMGETEVTQALWQAVMGTNPSHFSGQNLPVDNVNWFNAVEFCNRLSEIIGLQPYYVIDKDHDDPNDIDYNFSLKWSVIVNAGANGFRLPTEAEWEYAARGGKNSHGYKYSGSDNLDEVAWYAGNSCGETHTIKTKQPNELGIYDMSGNVWEWCYDWHGAYVSACLTNPLGVTKGKHRICRGGGICPANYNGNYRVSLRGYQHSSLHSMDNGFRLLLR